MPSLTVENYVKTIALIAARDLSGSAVSTGELAHALGVSPGTAMRHAFLGGADWSAYAARRGASTSDDGTR